MAISRESKNKTVRFSVVLCPSRPPHIPAEFTARVGMKDRSFILQVGLLSSYNVCFLNKSKKETVWSENVDHILAVVRYVVSKKRLKKYLRYWIIALHTYRPFVFEERESFSWWRWSFFFYCPDNHHCIQSRGKKQVKKQNHCWWFLRES